MVVIHNRSLQWLYWDLYKDSVPAPIWGSKIRWCIITKHDAACFCGIWDLCKEGLGSRLRKARTATNVCFHLLSQATLRALPDKSPWQSATQLREKITEAVMFIKHVYETACKETWSVATPLIAADYSDHTGFFRQESVLVLHSRTSDFSEGTFNVTCYSIGWHGSGLPDLFAVGTSTGGNSHWNNLELFHKKYLTWYQ